jgi:15-cis-phytoene synthase
MADNTCMELVRTQHRDRYLATLFAPDLLQPHLFALYGFDAEISRVPTLVSEPQIGEIRLQWWRDTIAAIYQGEAVDHPVAQAMVGAIRQGHLPQQPLQNLIDAHARELYADPMPSLNDLEGYLGETRSAVLQMAAQVLSDGKATAIADAAGFAGVAQGIAELFETLPGLPHAGQHLLPDAAPASLLLHAQARLRQFQSAAPGLPAQLRPAFLPLATVAARLEKLSRSGPGATLSPLRSQWLIWRASRSG